MTDRIRLPGATGGGRPTGGRRMRAVGLGGILALAAGLGFAGSRLVVQAAEPTCSTSVTVNCTFGGFEIDGNTPSNGGTDWTSSTVNTSAAYTNFYDRFNTTADNIMSQGSKESDQSTWTCVTNKAPGKADLGGPFYTTGQFAANSDGVPWAGSIWFQNTHAGFADNVQYLYGDFQRYTTNGDVHLDYEFNKSSTLLGSGCTSLGVRSQGDVLITFDTSNGGAIIFVSAFKFVCSTTTAQGVVCPSGGSFQLASNLVDGSTFAGAANISPAGSDTGVDAGAFGEAGLDLTHTIGNFTCGEFGNAYMKTRSAGTSDIANGKAEVKDFTSPVPFNPGLCPSSHLAKAQADETAQNTTNNTTEGTEGGATDNTNDAALTYTANTAASPLHTAAGHELVYRLAYTNTGGGAASGVTVTDSIPAGTAFVANSCNPSCTTTGTPVTSVSFSLGSQTPTGATPVYMYFEVTVNATSTSTGTVTIENYGHVSATGETGSDSNHVFADATYAPASGLHKKEADVQPNNQYCNTATGGAASSNAACASLLGTAVSPTYVDGPISVTPGDVLQYQLVYSNTGNSPATGVVVSDSIPSGATYVASSCSPACTTTGTPVTSVSWTFSSVAAGGSQTVSFKVKLAATFANGTTANVSNHGAVVTDQEASQDSNTVVANVTATGALALIKSASVSGSTITYTITYFNTGSGNLINQTISDVIPSGLSFVSCSGGTGSCGNNSGTVTWTVDAAGGTSASSPAGTLTLVVSL
jgi:uncharacterized repeat protein (TIGR01451 family)